jgi:hypothetical protein
MQSHIEVVRLFETATSITAFGTSRIALEGALSWIQFAINWSDPSLLKSYQVALETLDRFLARDSSVASNHNRLASVQSDLAESVKSLGINAAACAIASNRVELALKLLEQGRNVLLTQAGKFRTRLDELNAVEPVLAERFRSMSKELEILAISVKPVTDEPAGPKLEDSVAK